jgi:carboxylesterase type B
METPRCGDATDKLDCLREVPPEKLLDYFTSTLTKFFWDPVVDGDFLPTNAWELMEKGQFAKVDLLLGTNMVTSPIPRR